eukprot:373890-Pyramimonas_sp.AAC.1
MLFPLLEKPKGGLRPILLRAGPVRVWERLRRPELLSFNDNYPRRFWAFVPGRSAEDAAWHQATRAEVAAHSGKHAVG